MFKHLQKIVNNISHRTIKYNYYNLSNYISFYFSFFHADKRVLKLVSGEGLVLRVLVEEVADKGLAWELVALELVLTPVDGLLFSVDLLIITLGTGDFLRPDWARLDVVLIEWAVVGRTVKIHK